MASFAVLNEFAFPCCNFKSTNQIAGMPMIHSIILSLMYISLGWARFAPHVGGIFNDHLHGDMDLHIILPGRRCVTNYI